MSVHDTAATQQEEHQDMPEHKDRRKQQESNEEQQEQPNTTGAPSKAGHEEELPARKEQRPESRTKLDVNTTGDARQGAYVDIFDEMQAR